MAEKIDEAKLAHLIEHWIEHNESHSKSFRDWAVKIETAGFIDAAKAILMAAERLDESSEFLKKARERS